MEKRKEYLRSSYWRIKLLEILTTLGIISFSTIVGISTFLFRRVRGKNHPDDDEKKKVVTFTLRGLQDIDNIRDMVDEGNVVILGVSDLARLDMIRLKRSIQQLKSFIKTNGGDIIALGKEFVVVVPSNMKLSQIPKILEKSNQEDNDELNPPPPPQEVGTL
ncbi:MAG: DUF552 domain-containing protein [Candidatus Heimdallarchaeota archaeon]|nr:DUF552 domain-containing protein [Candidatus Heimdallarchaeota archaeon]